MGCISSKMDGDLNDDSPTHAEQRSPLLDCSDSYTVSPLPDSPSLNPSSGNMVGVVSGAYLTPNQGSLVSQGGGTSNRNVLVRSAQLDSPSQVPHAGGQPLAYNTTDSDAQQPLSQGLNGTEIYPTDSLALNRNGIAMRPVSPADVKTAKGNDVMLKLKDAYNWTKKFDTPDQQFLSLMDRLYMECQLHLTALSSLGDVESKREADVIVNEMIVLRNHWGPTLLPSSICNAFVRERLTVTLGVEQRQFRIDCAQFFEPVPFYNSATSSSSSQGNTGELMKLYRFSVYDLAKNEVILRYYLERSNVTQLYHVLCFTCDNYRGQVHPYGTECPSYWEVRQHMVKDVYSRLLSALSQGTVPAPQTHASTIFPSTRGEGPVIIKVPAQPMMVKN